MSDERENPDNPGPEPWMQGYVNDKLCEARRDGMIQRIDGMEKNISNTIRISIAIAGFIISIIVLITNFLS